MLLAPLVVVLVAPPTLDPSVELSATPLEEEEAPFLPFCGAEKGCQLKE